VLIKPSWGKKSLGRKILWVTVNGFRVGVAFAEIDELRGGWKNERMS
jgi:hypothetical protein